MAKITHQEVMVQTATLQLQITSATKSFRPQTSIIKAITVKYTLIFIIIIVLGQGTMHHNSTSQFTMNNFMPSSLTSAMYTHAANNAMAGSEYSYDINLSTVNKSLNDYGGNDMLIGGGGISNSQ